MSDVEVGDIKEFLRIVSKLEEHDARQRLIRGYGALPDSDYPNQSYIKTITWLKEWINDM